MKVVRTDYRTLVRFDADVQIPHAEMIVAQGVFETILERYERDLEVLSLTTCGRRGCGD